MLPSPLGTDNVNGHCTSPTSQSCGSGKRLSSADVSKVNRWGPGRPPFRKAQSAACMEISLPVTTEGRLNMHIFLDTIKI